MALPCLDATGPSVDAIFEILSGIARVAPAQADVALAWREDRLELTDLRRPSDRPLTVEWLASLQALRSWPASRREPLARAVGRKTVSVIDATAGWGQDALRLMMMGYRLELIERSPVMAALLVDGRRRCFGVDHRHPGVVAPQIHMGDARRILPTTRADCVYLDPMFPPKRNTSALAKRPLELLRDLVGDDADRDALFDAAYAVADRRVVVKRPDHAPPLRAAPQESFSGKLVRYDVYLKPAS